ncbi:ABC transporter permease [Kitasatospora arboriphila]
MTSRAPAADRPAPPPAPPADSRPAGPAAPRRGITRRQRLRRDRTLLLMTLPAVGLLLVFNYVPLLGNVVAFQDYDVYGGGITGSAFVGFENFAAVFGDARFWEVVGNTLSITAVQLLLFFPIPIALALLLNSVMSGQLRTLVQSVLYLPHFFSWVLVITVFQQMLGGAPDRPTAAPARRRGLRPDDRPHPLQVPADRPVRLEGRSWGVIVFLAALSAVSDELYEAAAVDGAGRWRRMWHVTLPALRPVIALLLVLRVGDSLSVGFEQILLQRDAVGVGVSEVLDTYVWFRGIRSGDFSYAAAAGLVKGLFSLGMVLLANKAAHKLGEQGVYAK